MPCTTLGQRRTSLDTCCWVLVRMAFTLAAQASSLIGRLTMVDTIWLTRSQRRRVPPGYLRSAFCRAATSSSLHSTVPCTRHASANLGNCSCA